MQDTKDRIDKLRNILTSSKQDFVIERKRSNYTLIYKDKKHNYIHSSKTIDTSKKVEILSLFSQVKKQVTEYIDKKQLYIPEVKQIHNPVYKNEVVFKSLKKNDVFQYIDINHCFWRIAFIQGYINERLYKKILEKDYLKTYRNMALSCMIAPLSREYYDRGVYKYSITENRNLYQQVYNNIRFTAYNLCGEITEKFKDSVMAYKTDGVLCKSDVADEVKKIMEQNNFSYKEIACKKVSNTEYLFGETEKRIF